VACSGTTVACSYSFFCHTSYINLILKRVIESEDNQCDCCSVELTSVIIYGIKFPSSSKERPLVVNVL
jgi:hypothetical protein